MRTWQILLRLVPFIVGAVFLWAGIYKVFRPGSATLALESLGLPFHWANPFVAAVTAFEMYVGTILLLRKNLRYSVLRRFSGGSASINALGRPGRFLSVN